jgi:hypothetical protein
MGSELVVSGCDAAPLLELGEEAFDAPSLFVGDAIIAVLIFAMAAGRDDRLAALLVDEIVQAVGVIGAVGQNLAGWDATDQIAGGRHVVLLTGTEDEADRQAKRIDYGMDLGAEPASRAPESLGLSAPFFTRAPAAWA